MTFPNPLAEDDPLDAATLNLIFNELYDSIAGDAAIYTASFFPDEFAILNGNDIALTLFDSTFDEVYGHQSPSAIDDEWEHGAYLNADTYTISIRVVKTASSGILKIKVDDVVVLTLDLYAASDAVANVGSAGIVISTSQWHSIKGLVDSKNASSSGYDANIVRVYIRGNSA